MFFCLDLGNTRWKLAIMQDGVLIAELFLTPENWEAEWESAREAYKPTAAILSSVVDHPPRLLEIMQDLPSSLVLNTQTALPISICYDKPETLGVDRLALAVGAWKQFPHQHTLVISVGTAITYNFVHKSGQFMGGSISPGINLRFKALHQFTDKLPLISFETPYAFLGYNTKQSILSGVQHGALAEIVGMIAFYGEKYRNFNVVLTGGDLEFFASRIKSKIFASPYIIYQGLNSIIEHHELDKS
jgi:type III pantothenate kinase